MPARQPTDCGRPKHTCFKNTKNDLMLRCEAPEEEEEEE